MPECSECVDVLVVGGGVVGLTAAIGMASRGFSTAVLDAGVLDVSDIALNTRVYAINAASQALLTKLGVWAFLPEERRAPYRGMYIWDALNQAKIKFHARDQAQSELGFILEDSVLKQALLKRADELGVRLVSQARVSTCAETTRGMQVAADDGRLWNAGLLIVSDGANSRVRDMLDVALISKSYQHDALVVTVETEKPHHETAYQIFHVDGPLAFLPLKDPHQCSIVWSHPPERIKALMALEERAFELELAQALSHKLGAVRVLSARTAFPLQMRHVKQYRGRAWILLGDAAHTIHPLAGLGLNVGLADVSTWLRLLDERGEWSWRILCAYQRERKHAVWLVIALMQGIKSLFGSTYAPVNLMRGAGMRALNQLTPLKRKVMAYASGVDNEG
jgi:2-polyprenylphenol 6-hydroxylase